MFQNPHIDAIGCGATIYSDKVDWKTVVQQGNDKAVTSVQTVYLNSDPHPTTRDCTFVTDGHTKVKSYIDGQQVFSSNSMNPNMTKPFQSYLELQTNSKSPSTGQSYIGTFTDYYATTSDSIKVINAQAGSIVKVINATSGSTLASSTTDSSGTALVDVGKYHMPINANVVVFDSTGTNLLDSTATPASVYGGDVYNVGDSTVPQTTITVNGFDSTTNAPLQGIYTTISTGQTNVATGFLPITYSGSTYAQYTIIPQNYGTQIFDHWDDGSTDRARVLDPTASSATLTAYYVDAHPTSTDVEPNSPTVQEGHQITFTATVEDQYAPPSTPPGTVAFDDSNSGGSFSSPSCTLDSTGACTIIYTANSKAFSFPVTITGTYSPSDSTHHGSSGTSTLTVSLPAALLSPTSGLAGATVSVSGKGFAANSAITISFDGTNVSTNPATITTGSSGDFSSAIFTVPSSATVGKHTVSATDGSFTGSAQFTVKDTSALNITTEDSFGKTITGYFIILTQSGTTVASGFSPVTFTLTNGAQYSVGAGSFGNVVFDHWKDNGSTANPRLISISSDTALVAVYRTSAISLNPTEGPAGEPVTVSGNTFAPNSAIKISYDGTSVPTSPATITTNSGGSFTATFTVPASAVGAHTVNATDASSNSASAQFTVTTTSTLKVTSEDMLGNTITGYHVSLSQGGTTVASGFTPVSLTVNDSAQYSLDITSFQPYVFDHWKDNGSTADPRSISINADTQLTAVYKHTALALNPSMGPVSTVVTMEISGFPANAELHLLYDGASVSTTPATMTTNPAGNFP